jgi:hypothetical protein
VYDFTRLTADWYPPKPSRVGKVQLSTWQTPEAVRQLRILAAEESTTIQALMADGLNFLFAKYGKPPVRAPRGGSSGCLCREGRTHDGHKSVTATVSLKIGVTVSPRNRWK